ncbi:MAG TPA: archaemetzincin [Planctomycetota bacterium]|nr:archaemetzincin [Planctomycetota bacterium]
MLRPSVLLALASLITAGEAVPDLARIERLRVALAPLHVAKTAPVAGEWLATQKEPGQTFAEYRVGGPNRPQRGRRTLVVQPLGAFDDVRRPLLALTADLLERYFQLPVVLAEAIDPGAPPARAHRIHPRDGNEQLLAEWVIVSVIAPRRRPEAVATLGLMVGDLWPGGDWNFVFGYASNQHRAGVWSLHRLGDPERELEALTLRTLKTAVHETGHMLGIDHCIAHECLMNGAMSRDELDSRPMWFCPECVAKIWWSCGADPARRCDALAEFAGAHGLADAQRHWLDARALIGE